MNYPWDEPPDPGFTLPDPRFPQAQMPPISEPDYLGEMNAPQEQTPDDFWSRMAIGTGGQGFQMPQFGPRPTGLEVLLSALGGFVNAKTRQGGQRISETDQRNACARDAAKTLATWRHAERVKNKELGVRKEELASNQSFQRDQLKIRLADSALARGDLAEHRRIMESLSRESLELRRDKAGLGEGGGDPQAAVYQTWAKRLQTGEVKLSQVPQALRTGVLNAAGTILPEKARTTVQEINAARTILATLSELSGKIPRGKPGVDRFVQGIKSDVEGVKQSEGLGEDVANYKAMAEGMLANLSRASGERGVLTNQDIDRIKSNIPTTKDTDTVARRKISNLDELFNELQERTIRTYTTDMGNAGARVAAPATGGVIELVRDANGNIVRKQ